MIMEINREETRKQLSITLVPVLLNLKKDSRRLTYNMTHVTEGKSEGIMMLYEVQK